jgi:hypothetical protein
MWEPEEDPDSITKKLRLAAEMEGAGAEESGRGRGDKAERDEEFRPSKPPKSPEERELYAIFRKLKGKDHNLIEKRRIANEVLNGKYGTKKKIHAKFLLGPQDFESVAVDPREDVVPALIELAENNDVDVRAKAARALGERGDERALLVMYKGLGEEKYWARYEFATALGRMFRNIDKLEALHEAENVLGERAKEKGEGSNALRLVRKRIMELSPVRRELEKQEPAFVKVEETLGRRGVPGRGGERTQPMQVQRPQRLDTTQKMFVEGKGRGKE